MISGGITITVIRGVSSNTTRNVMLVALRENSGNGRRVSSSGSGGGSCSARLQI